VPNSSARTLRTRRNKVLGMLPTLANPVFAQCLQGIAEEAETRGYAIVLTTTEYSPERRPQQQSDC
jgi:DNA-binding LacI/PurR family transcriptional regulator